MVVVAIVIIVICIVVAIVQPEFIPALIGVAGRAAAVISIGANRYGNAVISAAAKIAPAAVKGATRVEEVAAKSEVSEFKSSPALGKAAHNAFSGIVEGQGGIANRAVFAGSKLRPDGYFPGSNKILELKLGNLRGVQARLSQPRGYSDLAGDGASTELWLYNVNGDGSFNFIQYNL